MLNITIKDISNKGSRILYKVVFCRCIIPAKRVCIINFNSV